MKMEKGERTGDLQYRERGIIWYQGSGYLTSPRPIVVPWQMKKWFDTVLLMGALTVNGVPEP